MQSSTTGIYHYFRLLVIPFFLLSLGFFLYFLLDRTSAQTADPTPSSDQFLLSTPTIVPVDDDTQYLINELEGGDLSVSVLCGTLNPVPDEMDWLEYRHEEFQFSFQFPENIFEVRESNDCKLVELVPPSKSIGPKLASVFKYYVSFLAIETEERIDPGARLKSQLQNVFSFPDIAEQIDERQFSVGGVLATEFGPIPGQMDQNILVLSSESLFLQVNMYPAPTNLGGDTLPRVGSWHESQELFPSYFYKMLNTIKLGL